MGNPLPIAATFSKDPAFWAGRFEPVEMNYGLASCSYGHDGGVYIDWVSSLGANLLGHSHEKFCRRVSNSLWEGTAFSLPHRLEHIVADKLVNLLGSRVPGWHPDSLGVRFGLSGTDATTMAIRLARAVTGRKRVLSSGYHGWSSEFVSTTPPAWGCVEQGVEVWDIRDMYWLEQLTSGVPIAAVIIETPIGWVGESFFLTWWQQVRDICTQQGALLILDEVVTWPRYSLGGAAEIFKIEPDIACYGKALGNGIPVSCIIGHREYFDWFSRNDPVFVSSTGFGNSVSLAAADAVLDLLTDVGIKHIWDIGSSLAVGLQEAGLTVIGEAPRSLLQFPSPAEKAYFTLGMRDLEVLINRPNLPNLAHTKKDVQQTIIAANTVCAKLAQDRDRLDELVGDRLPRVLFEGR